MIEHGARAARLAAHAGWLEEQSAADHLLATACYHTGRLREGLVHGNAALQANRELGLVRNQSVSLQGLGNLYCALGDLDTAVAYGQEQLETASEAGNDALIAIALVDVADANYLRGRLDIADEYMKRAFKLESGRSSVNDHCELFRIASGIHLVAGRVDEALANAGKAVADLREFPLPRLEAGVVHALAKVLDAIGEHHEAIAHYDRALELIEQNSMDYRLRVQLGRTTAESALQVNCETDYRLGEAESLRVAAAIVDADGQGAIAKRHRRASREIYREIGAALPAELSD